jgi:hypothetical protein
MLLFQGFIMTRAKKRVDEFVEDWDNASVQISGASNRDSVDGLVTAQL